MVYNLFEKSPMASTFAKTVVCRVDAQVAEAMLHVKEREGLLPSEQARIALVHWLACVKGVLHAAPGDVRTLTPRRPGRPRRLHRGHVVTYRTDEGLATGLVTDDRQPGKLVVIQLDPPSATPLHLHPGSAQRRYFTAGQLASWIASMPAAIVGDEMARATRLIRRHREWDPQRRVDAIASLWFGAHWKRIDYVPGMPPVYVNAEVRRVAGAAPAKARRQRG